MLEKYYTKAWEVITNNQSQIMTKEGEQQEEAPEEKKEEEALEEDKEEQKALNVALEKSRWASR